MIMPSKNNKFIDAYSQENRKKKAAKALHEAFHKAENGEWAEVLSIGLEYPELMNELILRYYGSMPERIKYVLPVKWYMAAGKTSDAVCKAVSFAGKFKPVLWIGKGQVTSDCLEIFCCVKGKEDAKNCLSWSLDYGTSYLKAMKINAKVFKAYIAKEEIIAFDSASAEPVIQYGSAYAIQQVFPLLPLSACK